MPARKSKKSVKLEMLHQFHEHVLKTYRTDRQIESLLFPALAVMSMLNDLALGGSVKARKSLLGLISIGNQLAEKLKAVESK